MEGSCIVACDNVSQAAQTTPHRGTPPREACALTARESERIAWDECVGNVRGALEETTAANKRLMRERNELRDQLAAALAQIVVMRDALAETRDAMHDAAASAPQTRLDWVPSTTT
jgi:hypothetical protein